MCKQTETMHVDKQLKPEQLKEPIAVHDCDQHLSNSQLYLAMYTPYSYG